MIRDSIEDMKLEPNTNTLTSNKVFYCVNCHQQLVKNGYAKRNEQVIINDSIQRQVYQVPCYTCPVCHVHHRLIPNEWYPFKRYTKSAVQHVKSSKYPIYETSLIRQQARFKSREFVNIF